MGAQSNNTSKFKSKAKPKKVRKKSKEENGGDGCCQLQTEDDSAFDAERPRGVHQPPTIHSIHDSESGMFHFFASNDQFTKRGGCDADGVTINTKWFPPSSTSRSTKRLSFSGQEFL